MNFKNKILLPKKHFSWSQLSLWTNNPEGYKRSYFYGEKYVNKAMEYGKKLSTALETGNTQEDDAILLVSTLLTKYKVMEKELKVEFNGIPLIGYADTYQPRIHSIREYKTGKTPWTQNKVNNHDQLTFYAFMIYKKFKKLPAEIYLDWAQTEYDQDGDIQFTGTIQSFKTERSLIDVIKMGNKIEKAVAEISEAYKKEFNKLI